MASVNRVFLIGNLGRDPEIRTTPTGRTVVNFSMATTETWNDNDGQKQSKTDWHKVVVFGKLADICGKYLIKGKSVYIEGRIQTRKWQDKDGNTRYTTEIVANTMQMLGTRGDSGNRDNYSNDNQSSYGGDYNTGGDMPPGAPPDVDDDIPF